MRCPDRIVFSIRIPLHITDCRTGPHHRCDPVVSNLDRRVHTSPNPSTTGVIGQVVLRVPSSQRRQLKRVGCVVRLVVLQNHTQCFARQCLLRPIDERRRGAGHTHGRYRVDRCSSIASSVCGSLRVGGEGSALTDATQLQREYHRGQTMMTIGSMD